MPEFLECSLDPNKLARRVYREASHRTTSWGAIIEREIKEELQDFLSGFLRFLGNPAGLFFRLDAFMDENSLTVIEINAELQDGWGVAFNLLRAAGVGPLIFNGAALPQEFVNYGDGHRQEFELACEELSVLGHECRVTDQILDAAEHPKKSPFDSKLYLAQFRHQWAGQYIQVPMMYSVDFANWESIPPNVVLKFTEKYGPEAKSAGYSVIPREKAGRARFLRECYNQSTLIAQERVNPTTLADGNLAQVVILCSGPVPITGYIQVAPPKTFVINDRTAAAGMLVFE